MVFDYRPLFYLSILSFDSHVPTEPFLEGLARKKREVRVPARGARRAAPSDAEPRAGRARGRARPAGRYVFSNSKLERICF